MVSRRTQYSVQYGCGNCGWSGTLKFDIGRPAPGETLCPKCKCKTATKQVALPFVPTPPIRPGLPKPEMPWWPPGPFDAPRRPRRWWRDDQYRPRDSDIICENGEARMDGKAHGLTG